DHLVVGLDANDDILSSPIKEMFTEIGMREAILHENKPDQPPETNYKNGNGKPIDGIFVTAGIRPTQGGHTGYKVIMDSDHRTLWLDIPFISILGFNPPNLHKYKICPIKAGDPRSVEAYNSWIKEGYQKHDGQVWKDYQKLKQMRKDQAPLEEIIALHSAILTNTKEIREWAAKRVRKSFNGKYAWSPEWRELKLPTLLWKMALKRFDGRVQPRYLRRLMTQCNEPDALKLTKEEVKAQLKKAEEEVACGCV
ncbi:MAG: hypothetical protein AAF587_45150, partial [Bacteroidota bacterium]